MWVSNSASGGSLELSLQPRLPAATPREDVFFLPAGALIVGDIYIPPPPETQALRRYRAGPPAGMEGQPVQPARPQSGREAAADESTHFLPILQRADNNRGLLPPPSPPPPFFPAPPFLLPPSNAP